MKNAARLALALLLYFCLSAPIIFAQNVSQQRRWTLGQRRRSQGAEIHRDPSLEASQWTDLQSNREFITRESLHPSCDEFSVDLDHQTITPATPRTCG